jgi:hypothetical protein
VIQQDRELPVPEQEDEEPERERERPGLGLLWNLLDSLRDDLFVIVIASVAALLRAMGITVRSGFTGLRFSFGRARGELEPGFHFLVPFLQNARVLPTRSRTLELPAQRVATFEGLVYHADANLVYRIIDVRKALIMIDQLERGMTQMLGLGVQEVLRHATRVSLRDVEALNAKLAETLQRRLEAWGVQVERVGFPSITPSPQSLRITQLREVTGERIQTFEQLSAAGVATRRALGLIGTRSMPARRTRTLQLFEIHRRRVRRLRRALKQKGWTSVQIKHAESALFSRVRANGRVRAISR